MAAFRTDDGQRKFERLVFDDAGAAIEHGRTHLESAPFGASGVLAYDGRIHKPKLVMWNNCDDFDVDAAIESFFNGIASHERGAKVWNDSLDESK